MSQFSRQMVLGLQGSGKTTYAAALWYILANGGVSTVLSQGTHTGDFNYLDQIAELWEQGYKVPRTEHFQNQNILINMLEPLTSKEIVLQFADLPGEGFERAFASRRIADPIVNALADVDGLMVFVSAAIGRDDVTIIDMVTALGTEDDEDLDIDDDDAEASEATIGTGTPFVAGDTPRDVQVVDLIQSLQARPIEGKFPRIAVIISAWDKVSRAPEPEVWLSDHMPLLDQFLKNSGIPTRIYGVSAQGGDVPKDSKAANELDRKKLLSISNSGERVGVVGYGAAEHDLTHPIRWLSGLEAE